MINWINFKCKKKIFLIWTQYLTESDSVKINTHTLIYFESDSNV